MNHLDKQLEASTPTLEQYLTEQDRRARVQQRLDRLGLMLMILCGLMGLFYCIANANSFFKKANKESLGLQLSGENYEYAIAGLSQVSKQKTSPDSNYDEGLQAFVHIEGSSKAGETQYFLLDDYDPAAEYRLHLGNGDTRLANSAHFAYAYDYPGSYEVLLEVTYQGETAVAFSKILRIR